MTGLISLMSFERALRALLVLNLFDLVSTQIWVHSGLFSEANPVMAQAMDLSPLSFGAAKMGLVMFSVGLLWLHRDRRFARIAVLPALMLYVLVSGGHVGMALQLI
jgi:hypothetical protein